MIEAQKSSNLFRLPLKDSGFLANSIFPFLDEVWTSSNVVSKKLVRVGRRGDGGGDGFSSPTVAVAVTMGRGRDSVRPLGVPVAAGGLDILKGMGVSGLSDGDNDFDDVSETGLAGRESEKRSSNGSGADVVVILFPVLRA